MSLSLEDTWIKAAVEHRLVTVTYVNPETRLAYTKRDVRPDFVGPDRAGVTALWGLLNHNPFVGIKSFAPQHFQMARLTPQRFAPPSDGRWQELVQTYKERGLDRKDA